jgi:hypothetical protein
VPLGPFLEGAEAFTPNDLTVLNAAFMEPLSKLGLKDRNDPMAEIVARRIIRAALDGERDGVPADGDWGRRALAILLSHAGEHGALRRKRDE